MGVRRREVIALLGSVSVAWPAVAQAQETGRIYRIGGLHQSPRNAPHHVAFYAELERQGIVEGKNLIVDARGYGLPADQFAEHAQQVLREPLNNSVEHGTLCP